MAAVDSNPKLGAAGVAKIQAHVKGESLWSSAWKRLLRNRLAIMGLFSSLPSPT